MHEPVENRVAEGRVADDVMPLVDGELAGHDGRAHAVAVLEHLEQVEAVLGAERGQPQSSINVELNINGLMLSDR